MIWDGTETNKHRIIDHKRIPNFIKSRFTYFKLVNITNQKAIWGKGLYKKNLQRFDIPPSQPVLDMHKVGRDKFLGGVGSKEELNV